MTNKAKPLDLRTNLEQTAQSFEAYLDSDNEPPEEAQIEAEGDESVEEAVVEEEAVIEEEIELEAEDNTEEEYDDELEASDETLEEEQVEEEEQEELRYAVKVNGNELEVTLDELKSGYSRQQDYTKKSQSVAQERKAIQQQRENLVKSENLYKELLPKLEAQLKNGLADEPDFERLYEEDPIRYVKVKDDWNKQQEMLKSTQAEKQRLQKESQAKQAEKLQKWINYGETQILEAVPTWRDNEIAVKEKMAIRDYAVNELGFTPDEIDQVYDYRLLLGLRDAYKFSKTKKAVKRKPTEKSSAKNRVAKPGSVTRKKTSTPLKRSKQRLAKSGKVQDAAKVFEQII
jgi:hypothetical protein